MQIKNSLAIFWFWLFISGTFIIFALESEMHIYKLGTQRWIDVVPPLYACWVFYCLQCIEFTRNIWTLKMQPNLLKMYIWKPSDKSKTLRLNGKHCSVACDFGPACLSEYIE